MRKLIYVTYNFPPVSTGSAPRNLRLTGHLVRQSWKPTVITPSPKGALPVDSSLAEMIDPGVSVVRTGDGMEGHREDGRSRAERSVPYSPLRRRVRRFVLDTLLQPDRFVTWLPAAVISTVRQARRQNADLIMTLGPPHSTHLAGLAASMITGLKWVPYFGDLWLSDGLIDWEQVPHARRFWSEIMEEMVVGAADGIVTTTPGSSAYFRSTYGSACPPVQTLWTGLSADETREMGRTAPLPDMDDGLIVTYTGFFMGNQSPEYFLRGMKIFTSRNPGKSLKLRIVGDLGRYSDIPELEDLGDSVELVGKVPYREVPRWHSGSHVLLLLLPPQMGNSLKNPAKTAEYLASGRPILAVAPEGDMTDLLRRSGLGYISDHSPEGICRAIEEVWRDLESGEYRVLKKGTQIPPELDMGSGVKELVSFLEKVVSS